MRDDRTYHCDVYIDADTIVKSGDTIVFWHLIVFDKPNGSGEKQVMENLEANLTIPRSARTLEFYTYGSNNQEMNHNGTLGGWSQAPAGSIAYGSIEAALRYAGSAQNTGNDRYGAMRFDYSYQAGSYVRVLRGTVTDPQGLWQALLPLQPPPGARGGYGMIGDDSLLLQAPGFGLRQLGNIARRYLTLDSVYVVQPSGFSDIGVQEGVFTSADVLNDTTLGWVFFDLRPKFEADLKKQLNLAP